MMILDNIKKMFILRLTVVMSLIMAACLLTACSEDEGQPNRKGKYLLNLLGSGNSAMDNGGTAAYVKPFQRDLGATGSNSFVPGTPEGGTAPTGVPSFSPYNELYPVPVNKEYTTIGAFLVAANSTNSYSTPSGYFRWEEGNKWTSTVGIDVGNFYLFGYMPSNAGNGATVSLRDDIANATWADGCKIVISNLSTLTPADVCVVVGVKKWDNSTSNIYDPSVVAALQQGQYAYEGTATNNYVYLLLDHLYTNVNMELCVNADYAALRTIKLKKVSLLSTSKDHVDVTVILQNSASKPIKDISYTWPNGSADINSVLFSKTDDEAVEVSSDPDAPTSIPGYFAPGSTTQSFKFEFVYDVYDKKGNLVRKDCKAINNWSLAGDQVFAGRSFKITATIIPTYLYQLSDPDLDNPMVKFN